MKHTDTANTLGALALAIVDGFHLEISDATGLPPIDAAALNAIAFRPGCSIRMLAELLDLTHPGAVRCTDRLAGAGLVERRPGPDARTVSLRITRAGRSRWDMQRRARMTWLNALVDSLPSPERATLGEIVAILLQRLACDTEAAERICRLCDEGVCVPWRCPITDETRKLPQLGVSSRAHRKLE